VLLLVLSAVCLAASETYEGYKVYRMYPKTEEQKVYLRSLEESDELDFWQAVRKIDTPVDVMVKPKDQKKFVMAMQGNGMEPEIFIDDVQEKIKPEHVGNYNSRAGMTWTQYYRLADIYTWLDELAAAHAKASVIIGGSTYEGRQIKGLKINNGAGKKAVFLEGGIHAREWISPATVTYLTNQILTTTDPAFKQIADSFNWYIFPSTNPDGYEYTHTTSRLWRKTRTNYSTICKGADPNRNWAVHWMEQGSSSTCTSETYAGPSAFSEVETASLSAYIKTIGSELVGYIAFHSYSQLLMVPYGHTANKLDNYSEAVAIGQVALDALTKRYGTKYSPCGNIAETIYLASGGSMDWVKQEYKAPLSYTYELRDTGANGFTLPPAQIMPNNLEILDATIAMFQEAARRGVVTLV